MRLLHVLNLEGVEGTVLVVDHTVGLVWLLEWLLWLNVLLSSVNVSSFLLLFDAEHLVAVGVAQLTLVTDLSEREVVVVASLANPVSCSFRLLLAFVGLLSLLKGLFTRRIAAFVT